MVVIIQWSALLCPQALLLLNVQAFCRFFSRYMVTPLSHLNWKGDTQPDLSFHFHFFASMLLTMFDNHPFVVVICLQLPFSALIIIMNGHRQQSSHSHYNELVLQPTFSGLECGLLSPISQWHLGRQIYCQLHDQLRASFVIIRDPSPFCLDPALSSA